MTDRYIVVYQEDLVKTADNPWSAEGREWPGRVIVQSSGISSWCVAQFTKDEGKTWEEHTNHLFCEELMSDCIVAMMQQASRLWKIEGIYDRDKGPVVKHSLGLP